MGERGGDGEYSRSDGRGDPSDNEKQHCGRAGRGREVPVFCLSTGGAKILRYFLVFLKILTEFSLKNALTITEWNVIMIQLSAVCDSHVFMLLFAAGKKPAGNGGKRPMQGTVFAGRIVAGTRQALREIAKGHAKRVYIALDAQERIISEARAAAQAAGVPVEEIGDMATLGRRCRIAVPCAVAVLTDAEG